MKKLLLLVGFVLSCSSWVAAQNGMEGDQTLLIKADLAPTAEAVASGAPKIGYMTNNFGYYGYVNERYYFSVSILNANIHDLVYEWKSQGSDPQDVEIIPDRNGAIVTFKKRGSYQIYVKVSYPGSSEVSSASSNVSIDYH